VVSIGEYGRAASACSCARRSFAAETVFMALVICRVLTTLRILRRMSRTLGMNQLPVASTQLPVLNSVILSEAKDLCIVFLHVHFTHVVHKEARQNHNERQEQECRHPTTL